MTHTASTSLDVATTAPQRHLRFLLLAIAAVGAISALVWMNTSANTVYYMQVEELMSKGAAVRGQQVRVAGKVQPGTIHRDGTQVEFVAGDATGKMGVKYEGVVPDIFGPNIEVVVEGRYGADGLFEANTLLAKCPSKFESAPGVAAGASR